MCFQVYLQIVESFEKLPMAAVVNEYFCVHRGLSPSLLSVTSTDDLISRIDKPVGLDFDFAGVESDILWRDPSPSVRGFVINLRGAGYLFGEDVAKEFLAQTGFKGIIRAHQTCMAGYEWPYESRAFVLTVFSSCNYCEFMNDAAVLRLLGNANMEVATFPALTGDRIKKRRILAPYWLDEESEGVASPVRELPSYEIPV
jgi:diadenosine tetraphosphatase ApaH/serine/threonine PP2A family protein phosphatase